MCSAKDRAGVCNGLPAGFTGSVGTAARAVLAVAKANAIARRSVMPSLEIRSCAAKQRVKRLDVSFRGRRKQMALNYITGYRPTARLLPAAAKIFAFSCFGAAGYNLADFTRPRNGNSHFGQVCNASPGPSTSRRAPPCCSTRRCGWRARGLHKVGMSSWPAKADVAGDMPSRPLRAVNGRSSSGGARCQKQR
jgi:hypothetical protein